MHQYNFQDIFEPSTTKASGGGAGETVKNQYLSVSRYVAGQSSLRKDSYNYLENESRRNSEMFTKKTGKNFDNCHN